MIQMNKTLWVKRLNDIGGKLKLIKCKFTTLTWTYDTNGKAIINNSNQLEEVAIEDSENGQQQKVSVIRISDSYKLLRVHTALDGNIK
jgi:hypothetical protein